MTAAVAVYRWAYAVLAQDAVLGSIVSGIYTDVAPAEAALPFLVLSVQDARDVHVLGRSLAHEITLGVRVVGGDDLAPIEAAIERVDEILPPSTGDMQGLTVVACWRAEQQYYVEVQDGEVYRHAVAQYRVLAHES